MRPTSDLYSPGDGDDKPAIMEQQFSTSKVTVEYFDPHDVFKLITPGLVPRLPLHNLHWQSHAGPLRSIDTLHVDLVPGGGDPASATSPSTVRKSGSTIDDGFQTQTFGARAPSAERSDSHTSLPLKASGQRRHQIPGLRQTPYLKVLFVRCDDNDFYKNTVRSEIKEWVKTHTAPSGSTKKNPNQERHDAFEWLIVHVVLPNTVAATQPRTSSKTDTDKAGSRWRSGTTPLMEKLRTDFNPSSKSSVDHIAQIRIGINDLPYDQLPRVVPAVPTGYSEDTHDAENAWKELIGKFNSLILGSFDMRVLQYEEDIKEKDSQRALPGWNFCTFFILKEGLARGFESVGLVEDALVGYDELSAGLDSVVNEQTGAASPTRHGGAMLRYTQELREAVEATLSKVMGSDGDEEAVDLQTGETTSENFEEIPISATKKAYRDLILANNVSVLDFRCYIFARQITLLLRLGNAWSSREELLSRLKDQQDSVLHGVAPLAPPPKHAEESENLAVLAEICRRTLQFIPTVSHLMRRDIIAGLSQEKEGEEPSISALDPAVTEMIDNKVASFAFSVAQQILAQTSSKALPIPPSTLGSAADGHEQKASIPEPKTMMHPARTSSLQVQTGPSSALPPPSPGVFPGPGMPQVESDQSFLKVGLEDLAATRAELYMLSRSILDGFGAKRGWSDGWREAPIMEEANVAEFEDVSLDDSPDKEQEEKTVQAAIEPFASGIDNHLLQTAVDGPDNFYRLYEILTDKALRHYTVANHDHAVNANLADLAVLKFHLEEYSSAAERFFTATPFFGARGWSSLELSMLVMYLHCLQKLKSKDEHVRAALKLLTKYCAAEKERLELKSKVGRDNVQTLTPMKGVVGNLFNLAGALPSQVKVPLANFFTDIELAGAPEYYDEEDKCSLTINVRSLLPDEIKLDAASLRVTATDGGPTKELMFSRREEIVLTPGMNQLRVDCSSVIPGKYKVDHLGLTSSRLFLHFERDVSQAPSPTADIFKNPGVVVYHRVGALDAQLLATRHTTLDKNNTLDLILDSGWNNLKGCEVRVRPATGGLRLLTNEAKIVDSETQFARPPEAGLFVFGEVAAKSSMTVRFPYSTEQEVNDISAKVEVTYTTNAGKYHFARSIVIHIGLALGVNVQDVFKHQALFSRFNVSSATLSPLRLFKTELLGSEVFECEFGLPPADIVMVLPRQPATFMYRVKRKFATSKKPKKTMYLKLHYTVLLNEVEELIQASVVQSLEDKSLGQFGRHVSKLVARETQKGLGAHELEQMALLGVVSTSFLADVPWKRRLAGLGVVPGTKQSAAAALATHIRDWQKANVQLRVPSTLADEPYTILIPVDIPSLPTLHTADIRLPNPVPQLLEETASDVPVLCTNQMLPATLHLRWTQIWDTQSQHGEDKEFCYEVNAPPDTWLLGGRRKGHFVISGSGGEPASSTPETEAEVPLVLIPLREGWLPYPSVEIKEIRESPAPAVLCEIDWRNLGETVRVVGGQKSVTVSLDASGPGGGPLVLESENLAKQKGRIVA